MNTYIKPQDGQVGRPMGVSVLDPTPSVPTPTTVALQRAVLALCELKPAVDGYGRQYAGQAFLNDWMGSDGSCAFNGWEFAKVVLPFIDEAKPKGKAFKARVDPRFVFGASISGAPDHISAADVPGRIAKYADDFDGPNKAEYVWVEPLGLLIAHEGKHRVAFMRAHAQPSIAAWVTPYSYPSPDRL